MAAVAKGTTVRNVTPVAYEYYDKGTATEAIAVGDLVSITSSGVSKAAASTTAPSGICIKDAIAGGVVEFARQGELDGFTGMTPGARLYPSASVAGGIDTSSLASTVCLIEAVTATRIYFRA